MGSLRLSRKFLGTTAKYKVSMYECVLGGVSTTIFAIQYLSFWGLRNKYLFHSICTETGVIYSWVTVFVTFRSTLASDIGKYHVQLLDCLEEVKMEISNNQTPYLKYPLLKSQILKSRNDDPLYQQQRYNPLLASIFTAVETQIKILDHKYNEGKRKYEQKYNVSC